PKGRDRASAGQMGVFGENFFRTAQKNKKIQFLIPGKEGRGLPVRMAEVEGGGCGGMEEHAVTPAAHEKGNGFIHTVVLYPVAIIGPKHHLLSAFVEAGEGFPAAVDLLVVRQAEGGGELPAIFGSGALETKGKGIGVAQASIVLEVNGSG